MGGKVLHERRRRPNFFFLLPGRVSGFKRTDMKLLPTSMTKSRLWKRWGLLLCRYLMMIRTSQHWIPKQSHLQWVLIAAPLSRLTKKQPHPVKNPLSLSVPSCVHSVKSTKKARRPCFLPRWLQKDHLCYQSNYNCSEGNWYVYCCPCFCWCSLYGRRDGKV